MQNNSPGNFVAQKNYNNAYRGKYPKTLKTNDSTRPQLDAKSFSNEIIEDLSLADFNRFMALAKRENLAVGKTIYRYGDKIDYLYFPLTAVMSQFQILEDGKMCETAMIGNEGCAGLTGLFSSAPASCWTEVIVAGSALKISYEAFAREFRAESALRGQLFGYANSYIEQLGRRFMCSYFHELEARFCNWLLMLKKRMKADRFSFTQEMIARSLGVHRPSLNCITTDLHRQQIILSTRGKIAILDEEKLRNYSCNCC